MNLNVEFIDPSSNDDNDLYKNIQDLYTIFMDMEELLPYEGHYVLIETKEDITEIGFLQW